MESLAGILMGQVVNSVNEQLQTLPEFDKEYKDKYVQFKYPKEYEVVVDELIGEDKNYYCESKGLENAYIQFYICNIEGLNSMLEKEKLELCAEHINSVIENLRLNIASENWSADPISECTLNGRKGYFILYGTTVEAAYISGIIKAVISETEKKLIVLSWSFTSELHCRILNEIENTIRIGNEVNTIKDNNINDNTMQENENPNAQKDQNFDDQEQQVENVTSEEFWVEPPSISIWKRIPWWSYCFALISLGAWMTEFFLWVSSNYFSTPKQICGWYIALFGALVFAAFLLKAYVQNQKYTVNTPNRRTPNGLGTINLIGLSFFGSYRELEHTKVVYYAFGFACFPIIPFGCYRVQELEREINNTTYNIFGTEKWNVLELLHLYVSRYGILALITSIVAFFAANTPRQELVDYVRFENENIEISDTTAYFMGCKLAKNTFVANYHTNNLLNENLTNYEKTWLSIAEKEYYKFFPQDLNSDLMNYCAAESYGVTFEWYDIVDEYMYSVEFTPSEVKDIAHRAYHTTATEDWESFLDAWNAQLPIAYLHEDFIYTAATIEDNIAFIHLTISGWSAEEILSITQDDYKFTLAISNEDWQDAFTSLVMQNKMNLCFVFQSDVSPIWKLEILFTPDEYDLFEEYALLFAEKDSLSSI